jgi:hypothetical protein
MPSARETGVFTVAAVRRPRGKEATQILFNEHQRFFTLAATGRAATALTTELRSAARKQAPLKVVLDSRRGVIQRLAAPSAKELEEFRRNRTLLDRPERTLRVEVATIDPSVFNIVDHHLRARIFRLCKRIVPSYKKAKEIFDFCAAQSCHLGAPAVPPCIPFQYVHDGCHAPAHQMRKIIDNKYGYCVEKVFSFANQGSDTLRVRADKWGGCCVAWWFHVAPLLRVRLRFRRFSIVLAIMARRKHRSEPARPRRRRYGNGGPGKPFQPGTNSTRGRRSAAVPTSFLMAPSPCSIGPLTDDDPRADTGQQNQRVPVAGEECFAERERFALVGQRNLAHGRRLDRVRRRSCGSVQPSPPTGGSRS